MLIFALICNSLAAVLFILAAVKYGTEPVPVTYHRLILEREGTELTPSLTLILTVSTAPSPGRCWRSGC